MDDLRRGASAPIARALAAPEQKGSLTETRQTPRSRPPSESRTLIESASHQPLLIRAKHQRGVSS
eukprot:7119200-Heterocapsa_arctica.AAC.1